MVLGNANVHSVVDNGDSFDERAGAMPNGDALPALLQLPRRLCQVAGPSTPPPLLFRRQDTIAYNVGYSTGDY